MWTTQVYRAGQYISLYDNCALPLLPHCTVGAAMHCLLQSTALCESYMAVLVSTSVRHQLLQQLNARIPTH